MLDKPGQYDLIFADAQGGKWSGLDRTVAALAPRGLLVVDDMTPRTWWEDEHARQQERVRQTLHAHSELVTVELDHGSGVMLATRRF